MELTNILIRLFTITLKSLFIFYLATIYPTEIVGNYSVVMAVLFIFVVLTGFELQWNTVNKCNTDERNAYLYVYNHLRNISINYLIVVVGLFFLLDAFFEVNKLFFIICFSFEFLCQQAHHSLIAKGKVRFANLLMLIRFGGGAISSCVVLHGNSIDDVDVIGVILIFNSLFSLFALLFFLYFVKEELVSVVTMFKLKRQGDKHSFVSDYKVSFRLLLVVAIVLILESYYKFFLEYNSDLSTLGVLAIYLGVLLSVESLIVSGVISVKYSKLLGVVKEGGNIKQFMSKYFKSVFIVSTVLYSSCVIISIVLFDFLPVSYDAYYHLFLILAFYSFFRILEQPYKYLLIVYGRQNVVLLVDAISLFILAILMYFLYVSFSVDGVVFTMLFCAFMSFSLKFYFCSKQVNVDDELYM